jgi:hypothetical protein
MIRPQAMATLHRWREMGFAAGTAIAGAAIAGQGGYLLGPLGAGLMLAALPLGLAAYRRLRFVQTIAAEGLIEVVEREIRYYAAPNAPLGPASLGGFVSIADVIELRLLHLNHARYWRLKTQGGQALLIPVDAAGHDALFDAFAALPGLNSAALVDALSAPAPIGTGTGTETVTRTGTATVTGTGMQVLWRREGT